MVENQQLAESFDINWNEVNQKDLNEFSAEIDGKVYNTNNEGTNPQIAEQLNYDPEDKETLLLKAMLWDIILNDKWAWFPVWGEQRVGKTSFQLQVGYEAYHSAFRSDEDIWNLVLEAVVSNLSGLMYRMDKKSPLTIPTTNGLHERVPFVIYDDWGGESNKAETQYKPEFDILKGGLDMFGTKLAIICGSMVDPSEPTTQLVNKYTHEVFIPRRGVYKLDKVTWRQDFYGWKPKRSKVWIETKTFTPVPLWVYKKYDVLRQSRVDELEQRIRDTQASGLDGVIKRMDTRDYELLFIIYKEGLLDDSKYERLYKQKYGEAFIKIRSRDLIVTTKIGKHNYKYDITNSGLEVLKRWNGFNDKRTESEKASEIIEA